MFLRFNFSLKIIRQQMLRCVYDILLSTCFSFNRRCTYQTQAWSQFTFSRSRIYQILSLSTIVTFVLSLLCYIFLINVFFNRGFLEYPIFLDATAVCFVRFAGKKRKWWIELETCFLKKCYFYVLTNDTRATCYSENESTCFETSSLSTKRFFCGNFPNYSLQLCRQISSSSM